jgi:acetyl-CoA carboxylase alpha subunit
VLLVALGTGAGDTVLMMENTWYSVIFARILFFYSYGKAGNTKKLLAALKLTLQT